MELKEENVICRALAGSHMYGLNTAASDEDFRGIYLDDSLDSIIGLGKNKFQEKRGEGDDIFMFELRNYLDSLRKMNTQSVELIFNEKWLKTTPLFKVVQENRSRLLDSSKLFFSLTGGGENGYVGNELRLGLGERTGKLGKRKEALDKYGYSPKNISHLLRLCYAGIEFFQFGIFTTLLPGEIREHLLDIKVNPEKFNKAQMEDEALNARDALIRAYEQRKVEYTFDANFAATLCHFAYWPTLDEEGVSPMYQNLEKDLNKAETVFS